MDYSISMHSQVGEQLMDITTRSVNDMTVFQLSGRFDAHEAPAMTERLKQITAQPPARVIVNLSGVTFIDSTALGTLVQGMKRCRLHQGDLRICNVQQPVRVIFELTRLDRAFAIFELEDQAVAAPWSS